MTKFIAVADCHSCNGRGAFIEAQFSDVLHKCTFIEVKTCCMVVEGSHSNGSIKSRTYMSNNLLHSPDGKTPSYETFDMLGRPVLMIWHKNGQEIIKHHNHYEN